jgi:hypothetical protein
MYLLFHVFQLGAGASGDVFTSVYDGDDVAIKVFKGDVSPDGRAVDELEISCAVDHPNIIKVSCYILLNPEVRVFISLFSIASINYFVDAYSVLFYI